MIIPLGTASNARAHGYDHDLIMFKSEEEMINSASYKIYSIDQKVDVGHFKKRNQHWLTRKRIDFKHLLEHS